ncbi:hypothetical protein ACNI3T_03395 [Christiangramia sp. ASW11-125]|uniref:hypothetical protein n=1 Tax=Christiangramia sp. ASW11-125 TaxID=3400701 RepID=UPI003AADAD7D
MNLGKGAYILVVLAGILIAANFWLAYPDSFDIVFYLLTISNLFILITSNISIRKLKNRTDASRF